MKNSILKISLFVFGIATCFGFSGCNNSEDLPDSVTPENGMGRVSFKIIEKDYEPGEEVAGTRAAAQPQTELQDLGDGLMAEVSLVPDTPHRVEDKPKTRAIYTPTHYTIQAYQGGVLKGQIKGTFNGSTFTPDAGEPESISLPHGTYDFVCFNDKVTANGTQYTVNRADAGTARFTVKRGVLINQDPKQYVAFEMKHVGAVINLDLSYANFQVKMTATRMDHLFPYPEYICQAANIAERVKFGMESLPNSIPETMIYNFTTNSYSYPSLGTQPFISSEISSVSGGPLGSISYSTGDTRSSGFYCLPTTDCSKIKVKFTFGELYGHGLAGKSIMVPTNKLVEANKSYKVVVNLLLSPSYLFSDGTTGALTPGKTPVGVVLNPYQKIAVALNDATPTYGSSNMQWASYSSQESTMPATSYGVLFDKYHYMGIPYNVNYNPSSTALNAANSYYSSANYGTASGTNNVWYVPSIDDFLMMGVSLGRLPSRTPNLITGINYGYLVPSNAPATGFTGTFPQFPTMDMTRFNKAFTDAGGTAPSGLYWTSTECQDGSDYKQAAIGVNSAGYGFILSPKAAYNKVRPFIHY